MEEIYLDIAKALIRDSRDVSTSSKFNFSNMNILASQLEQVFFLRKSKENKVTLKNVADYVRKLS